MSRFMDRVDRNKTLHAMPGFPFVFIKLIVPAKWLASQHCAKDEITSRNPLPARDNIFTLTSKKF